MEVSGKIKTAGMSSCTVKTWPVQNSLYVETSEPAQLITFNMSSPSNLLRHLDVAMNVPKVGDSPDIPIDIWSYGPENLVFLRSSSQELEFILAKM